MAKVDKAARLANAKETRLKIHRGSTRRITRAGTAIDTALGAFKKEMDLQFFKADEDGTRVGSCDFVNEIQAVQDGIREKLNMMLHPPAEEEDDIEDEEALLAALMEEYAKMSMAELLAQVEADGLDIDTKGMKIAELREAVMAAKFGPTPN